MKNSNIQLAVITVTLTFFLVAFSFVGPGEGNCITCEDQAGVENWGYCNVIGPGVNLCLAPGFTCDGNVIYPCP